jgi:hypothetical protein
MAQVEQLIDGVYRLEVWVSGANTPFTVYFIKDGEGAIIEPGPGVVVPDIQEAARELGILSPRYIIPTHIHLDHAGGVGRLAEVFPDTKIVVNRQGAKHIIEPSRLIASTRMAFGDDFESMYGPILPVPEERLKIVRDGERLTLGSRHLGYQDRGAFSRRIARSYLRQRLSSPPRGGAAQLRYGAVSKGHGTLKGAQAQAGLLLSRHRRREAGKAD